MNSNKSIFLHVVSLIVVFAVFGLFITTAEAVTFSTTGDCKDVVNDGIPFTASVAIPPAQTEVWRDRIEVVIYDPDGNPYTNVNKPAEELVKEVVLYASSSGGTAYQCQQLAGDNEFSCNSFPAGATISRVSVRFVPKFEAANGPLVPGDYKISVENLNTGLEVFSGTAPVNAVSTACAWNQTPAPFTPNTLTTPSFVYNTNTACGGGGVKTFDFLESTANPFTIVSFPLGETIDPARWRIIASPQVNAFSYTLILNFEDVNAAPMTLTYNYAAGTDPTNATLNPTIAGGPWAMASTPVKLVSGSLTINPGPTAMVNMPTSVPLVFNVYYQNVDPTLGIQNSTFHFTRNMTMLFSPLCPGDAKYITTTPIDPCVAAKQVFSVPLAAPLNVIPTNFQTAYYFDPARTTFASAQLRHNYFYVQKCANADCTSVAGTDAYVYRVNVKDPESDTRYYDYAGLWDGTVTDIHMKFFGTVAETTLRSLDITVRSAGTYRIRGFYNTVDPASGLPNSSYGLEMYVTVPQKDGDATCLSAGQDGAYKAKWDGCKENHNPQTVEFTAINERFGFISNYSNQRLVFNYNPAISTVPMAGNVTELYCDWQVLADGYSASGAVCNPDRLELPPMTRAIVKGGKMYLSQRPLMRDGPDQFEYIMAYQRSTNLDNMNLFIDVEYDPCPMEAIPDTGYSLRSPAPLAQAGDGSFIFTGNALQIPAIGLGMDGGVPIVHLNYKDGSLESGWNLSMLGGYIGELEGGAYLPFAGNSVLTGHYYSQGVFVNLVNLKLEDEIIVFGNDGMKYVYSVTNSYWTEPTNVYQMFQPNGDRSLTLVTCDDYNFISDEYQKRYIVQATLVNSEPYQP